MPTISLMSFLKILTQGSPKKAQEYGKYLKPGGYQFYWMLKDAARSMMIDGTPYSECLKSIEEIDGRDVERECNVAALKALQSWMKKRKPEGYFDCPTAATTSPGGYLTVKVEPEVGVVIDGKRKIVQLYYSKHNPLSKHSVLLGNYLIQKLLCVGDYADCESGILDLRKKELLHVEGTPHVLEMLLNSELAWVDSYFKAQEDAAKVA